MDHWLAVAASMHPDRAAVIDDDVTVTYGELRDRAAAVSSGLKDRGVRAGDRVALAVPAGAEFVAALHGCWFAGAVAVPIDLRLSASEQRARATGAALIIDGPLSGSAAGFDSDAMATAGGFDSDAVAAVMHTSGTTAAPRRVELTYGNWHWSALGSAVALGLDQHERWLCPMPMVHVGGLSIAVRSAIYATTAVVHRRFDLPAVLRAVMDPAQRITLVSLVPTMLARLLDAGLREPPTVRWVLLGGGPIPDVLLARAREARVPVAPTYGMTETCSQIATHGWPLTGVQLRVIEGEVVVRGPNVAPGAVGEDGWLHTGDLGRCDDRGRLQITGRKADTIITGGENVAPTEVEAALMEHPAVADVGVFARPDREWGEAIVAAVTLRDGVAISSQELRAFSAARLAGYQVPKEIRFVSWLPRTASGKLLRRQLAADDAQRGHGACDSVR